MRPDRRAEAFRIHGSIASAFAAAAEAVEPEAWFRPRGEGKWSPAQIADHLIRTYDVLLREVRGGAGMKIRTRPWMRIALKLLYMPKILRGGRFPEKAPAPPEIRPAKELSELLDQKSAVALFRQRAAELDAAVQERPGSKITHAYFGTHDAALGVLFCARHIEHHRAQL